MTLSKLPWSVVFLFEHIVFEITESETLTDQRRLVDIIKLYRDFSFQTAIDDFGQDIRTQIIN